MSSPPKTKSAAIREKLGHPIIDGDGHTIEYLPLVTEYLREVGGKELGETLVKRITGNTRNYDGGPERVGGPRGWYDLSKTQRADMRVSRPPFWGVPTAKTLDRATVMLPNLFRSRMEELGLDFAIIYGTLGPLDSLRELVPELRIAACRAYNKMYADLYGPHADRMTVAALIPTGTPQEALDELDYAVNTLGMKAAVFGTTVRRPIAEVANRAPELAPYATWMDTLGLDSMYDYDPVWQKCVDLKVAVASHTPGQGFGYRTSPSSLVYNHLGHFGAAGEAFCKSMILGGVVERFPQLTFAFLEGGVGWACGLYNDLIEHWETRNVKSMRKFLDPALLDRGGLAELFQKYGDGKFVTGTNGSASIPQFTQQNDEDPDDIDDFRHLKITNPRKFKDIFKNFYFGCEAEDRMTAAAFNPNLSHFGLKMQAIFSSDVGHFDVTDITKVVADAYELVDDELLTPEDFKAFTFGNVAELYTKMNPDFFKGTPVEGAVAPLLAGKK